MPQKTETELPTDLASQLHQCALQLAEQRLPPGWELVDSSAFTRVACHSEQQLYYKEFLSRSPVEKLKAVIRGSRARRARKNADALLYAGIDAPASVAWGSLPGGREYLFSRAVPGLGVTQWLREPVEGDDSGLLARRSLLRDLGKFIGRMHATGFVHGDLRPGNVLATNRGERWHFSLIDNESNRHRNPPPGRALLKNLMQLNMLPGHELSRTDRMRFFCEWRRQMRDLSSVEAKIVAAEAYLWAMRRMSDKRRL